jgi:hypothetical protein
MIHGIKSKQYYKKFKKYNANKTPFGILPIKGGI